MAIKNPFTAALESSVKKTESPLADQVITKQDGAPVVRFTLLARNGRAWSYPYSYVGLIELPSPEHLIIHCNSREVERIEIKGRGLDQAVFMLNSQQLNTIAEADNALFAQSDMHIEQITVKHTAPKA